MALPGVRDDDSAPSGADGKILAEGTFRPTPELLAAIIGGDAYANVHTLQHHRGRSADSSEHNTDLIAIRGSCHAAKPPVESH